jgi:hypothetical protein
MSAGGIGGVGGRREKTTALADECDSRCGACAATLTDEELEGEPEALEASPPILEGRSAATAGPACAPGSPYASHKRARLDEAVIRPGGGFWVRQLLTAHRESVRWSINLHYRIASLQGSIACIGLERWVPGGDRSTAAGMVPPVVALGPAGACDHPAAWRGTKGSGSV